MATICTPHLTTGEISRDPGAEPVALGPDLVMYKGAGNRLVLYHNGAGMLGTFDDPAAAWSAIDAVDMPERMIAGG